MTTDHRRSSELLSECVVETSERVTSEKRVCVGAADASCISRFTNHSCSAKALFVDRCDRRQIVVVVVANKGIEHGKEVTVLYGKSLWLQCKCESLNCVSTE